MCKGIMYTAGRHRASASAQSVCEVSMRPGRLGVSVPSPPGTVPGVEQLLIRCYGKGLRKRA